MPIEQILTQGGLGFALVVAMLWIRDLLRRLDRANARLDRITEHAWRADEQAMQAMEMAQRLLK